MNGASVAHHLNLYNPAELGAERLLAEFVDRGGLLERLLGVIRDNTPERPQQHVVVIGARGLGKTMLLCALRHRVNGDAALAAEWLPISFYEEQYGIGDLADFWLEAIRHLETVLKLPPRIAGELLDQPGDDLAERAEARFFELLATAGKRALLMIDNLNEIFAAIQSEEALHRLRALLMEDARLMLVGTATSYFDEITDVGQPFHDFFRVFTLERLSQEQMDAVLGKLADSHQDQAVREMLEKSPERVRALRILTGGNPRLVRLGYRILRDGLDGDVRRDLEGLLDECTPFFKHRIESLAKEGRRVFDAIARRWDPVTVDDLRKELRKPSNYISAQMKRLIDNGFVEEAGGAEKKKRYQVAERFYNVYYLMRYSREGRQKLRWLIAFMKMFYTSRDYRDWSERLERDLSSGALTPARRDEKLGHLYTLVAAADKVDDRGRSFAVAVRRAIVEDHRDCFRQAVEGDPIECVGWLYLVVELLWLLDRETRQQLGFRPENGDWALRLARVLRERNLLEAAEAHIAEFGVFQLDTLRRAHAAGVMLDWVLGRLNDAEAAFRRAIELDPQDAVAWNGLSNALWSQRRYAEAEAAYRKALELDPQYVDAWNGLSNALSDQRCYGEAEAAYRKALELDPQYVFAWNGLGNALSGQRHYAEAEAAYRKSLELDPQYVFAWCNLGNALSDQRCYGEAEAAYRKALELDPQNASSWGCLGWLLAKLRRFAEAETAYCESIRFNQNDGIVQANLAGIYLENLNRPQEGIQALLRGVELDPTYEYAHYQFRRHWRIALPNFAARIAAASEQEPLRQLVLEQLIGRARFGERADVLAALQALELPPQQIFEPLILALRALEDRSVLYQIAREKRDLVLDVMARIEGRDTPDDIP